MVDAGAAAGAPPLAPLGGADGEVMLVAVRGGGGQRQVIAGLHHDRCFEGAGTEEVVGEPIDMIFGDTEDVSARCDDRAGFDQRSKTRVFLRDELLEGRGEDGQRIG